jgi:toxin ParE1/3/4
LSNLGPAQAERYLGGFERCAKSLAGNPSLGRPCEWIRPGLRRFEKGQHVLFYRPQRDGIFVSRILHQSMLPRGQSFEDAAPEARAAGSPQG